MALGALSRGDLTVHIAQQFAPEYEELRTNFNNAGEPSARDTFGSCFLCDEYRCGNARHCQQHHDLSRRTEQQAALAGRNRSARVDEITTNVSSSLHLTERGSPVAKDSNESAAKSGAVGHRRLESHEPYRSVSHPDFQLYRVIDDIAFQTTCWP